jgi:hypothetical protein
MNTLCWLLVYCARAIEWCRLWWSTAVLALPGTKRRVANTRASVFILTRLGRVLVWPSECAHLLAVGLIVASNRRLPPVVNEYGEAQGFLARLYPRAPRLR